MPNGVRWVAAVVLVAAGCAHHAPAPEEESKQPVEYRLSREDVVEVSVWKEPELSRTIPIRCIHGPRRLVSWRQSQSGETRYLRKGDHCPDEVHCRGRLPATGTLRG